jgi:hypothetical protein
MKNKIVGGLIVVTGLLFTGALFTDVPNLGGLGFITGMSALFTGLLIKEKA